METESTPAELVLIDDACRLARLIDLLPRPDELAQTRQIPMGQRRHHWVTYPTQWMATLCGPT